MAGFELTVHKFLHVALHDGGALVEKWYEMLFYHKMYMAWVDDLTKVFLYKLHFLAQISKLFFHCFRLV